MHKGRTKRNRFAGVRFAFSLCSSTDSESLYSAALEEAGQIAGPLTLPDIQRTKEPHGHNNRFLSFYTDPSRPEPQLSRKKTEEKQQKGCKNEARALQTIKHKSNCNRQEVKPKHKGSHL